MGPKSKSEHDHDTHDTNAKLFESFEKFTEKILSQMNSIFDKQSQNFDKHTNLLSSEIFDLKQKLDLALSSNEHLKKECDDLKKKNCDLASKCNSLESRLDSLEQKELNNSVTLNGVFQLSEPVTANSVSSFINSTYPGATLSAANIVDYSYHSKDNKSLLKVKLSSNSVKSSLFKLRKASPTKNLFLSECLIPSKYQLLVEAKKLAKSSIIVSAWSLNGSIFIKSNSSNHPIKVSSIGDLKCFIN